ncbi:MAG: NUDIX hydrolase [Actinomycetota bacterium]|nr:NUDIX hydrolase [Actinomycetota bacterium]
MEDQDTVRAAGGIVWRERDAGDVEVLVVHRPRHDDWTLPKGKAEPGEDDESCALREVEEETGLRCELGRHLLDVEYRDDEGRPKVARYWEMRPLSGSFSPHEEVDQVRWVPLDGAAEALSHDGDVRVAEALRHVHG